jgi:tetratricopeptide (TPR) repeat protein
VALRPAAPWGYSVRGLALAQQKRYPEAEQDLDRAVQLSPESRPSRLNRGVVYWAQKKQDQALADFSAVLQPPGERRIVESAYYRGQLYLQLGELEKALHDFNLVATEKPSFRPVYLLRARIHLARGDRVGALANLDEYLGGKGVADRPAWQVHDQRGRILRMQYAEVPLDQRDRPSARALANLTVAELEQAVVAGGRTAELYDDLGAMLELTGQLDKAIAAYDQGLAIAPDNIKLRLKRGWAHVQQGEYNKARADFSAATRANQDNAEAHTGMGYVVATGKSMAEAQREADLALLWGGDNYLIVHNVACIYAVLSQAKDPQAPGHEEAAMALIRKAIALWKQGSTGPSEIDLVKSEPAFAPLRSRTDFQILLQERGP